MTLQAPVSDGADATPSVLQAVYASLAQRRTQHRHVVAFAQRDSCASWINADPQQTANDASYSDKAACAMTAYSYSSIRGDALKQACAHLVGAFDVACTTVHRWCFLIDDISPATVTGVLRAAMANAAPSEICMIQILDASRPAGLLQQQTVLSGFAKAVETGLRSSVPDAVSAKAATTVLLSRSEHLVPVEDQPAPGSLSQAQSLGELQRRWVHWFVRASAFLDGSAFACLPSDVTVPAYRAAVDRVLGYLAAGMPVLQPPTRQPLASEGEPTAAAAAETDDIACWTRDTALIPRGRETHVDLAAEAVQLASLLQLSQVPPCTAEEAALFDAAGIPASDALRLCTAAAFARAIHLAATYSRSADLSSSWKAVTAPIATPAEQARLASGLAIPMGEWAARLAAGDATVIRAVGGGAGHGNAGSSSAGMPPRRPSLVPPLSAPTSFVLQQPQQQPPRASVGPSATPSGSLSRAASPAAAEALPSSSTATNDVQPRSSASSVVSTPARSVVGSRASSVVSAGVGPASAGVGPTATRTIPRASRPSIGPSPSSTAAAAALPSAAAAPGPVPAPGPAAPPTTTAAPAPVAAPKDPSKFFKSLLEKGTKAKATLPPAAAAAPAPSQT